jgi:hypothetical protein
MIGRKTQRTSVQVCRGFKDIRTEHSSNHWSDQRTTRTTHLSRKIRDKIKVSIEELIAEETADSLYLAKTEFSRRKSLVVFMEPQFCLLTTPSCTFVDCML